MYLCGLWDRAGVPGENPLGHREHTQEAVSFMTGSDSAVRQRSYSLHQRAAHNFSENR